MKRNLERAHRYSRLICGDILGCTRVIISHLKPWLLHIKNIITETLKLLLGIFPCFKLQYITITRSISIYYLATQMAFQLRSDNIMLYQSEYSNLSFPKKKIDFIKYSDYLVILLCYAARMICSTTS